jgi:hypothetical protein
MEDDMAVVRVIVEMPAGTGAWEGSERDLAKLIRVFAPRGSTVKGFNAVTCREGTKRRKRKAER